MKNKNLRSQTHDTSNGENVYYTAQPGHPNIATWYRNLISLLVISCAMTLVDQMRSI